MSKRPAEEIAEELRLVEQYKQSGNLEYLGALYKNYMHLVYGLCLKYLKNREESQDMVMEIFEKLSASLKEHEVANFKSWLYVLSKNACLMKLRSKKYQAERKSETVDNAGMENQLLMHHNDEESIEDDLQALESCIEKLQKEQKECVSLFYLQKKSYSEIESQTNYELKKVKSYIQNGKRNLKICLEKRSE